MAASAAPRREPDRDSVLMLLTISTDHFPATDLGYLLHKNPSAHHTAEFGFGVAHVLYPEAADDRCTAAVIVDVDPVGLVRNHRGPRGNDFSLAQYVNDRPYATSSFMAVALGKVFSTAMTGRSKERPELAEQAISLVCQCADPGGHEPRNLDRTRLAIPNDCGVLNALLTRTPPWAFSIGFPQVDFGAPVLLSPWRALD
jgi:hypothetical protein